MKAFRTSILALAASGLLMASGAQAANSLLGSLSDAANQQLGGNASGGSEGGYSMSQLTSLLGGSNSNLTSKSSTNAAGILQYCVKNNVLSATSATSVKDKLMDKLGIQNAGTTQKADYQDGLNGILHTGKGQNVDLSSLDSGGLTQLKEKVKTKACDVVLKQAKSFL
ncbi:hypothetical protein BS639_06620 [Rouxiella silvae]|uniref:DUF2501 domain-containing protein n=1 Tax=Rouxiella silvae TaxID=1646373 RepID=A0AA40X4N2_9GAMM|nr:DUF2501 domain-containing protein [Rouxiella silvae]KQN46283.1 hypothetical protein ASE93_13475 [Serratia sp. Leaf50]MBF6638269.1 DUF2501 domain-containing protein [Rouxiella silvae]ORJ22131.1 hypothetical protein BS639_06620 [Rouxiella silvae]